MVEVAKHALSSPAALYMGSWHKSGTECGTSHCIAGWAVHLQGTDGYELERQVQQPAAGAILLGAEAACRFNLSDDEGRSYLYKVLAEAGEEPLTADV